MTLEEVAQEMGLSISGVRKIEHRALEKLRKLFAGGPRRPLLIVEDPLVPMVPASELLLEDER